jgi:two-component system, LytTR family, response regulator AlgR
MPMMMKVLIADDEPLARLRLRSLIAGLPELDALIVGEAGDADEALAMLQAQPIDVVLLDIRMPGAGSDAGLHLAEGIKQLPHPPAVIFVTAYAEHALRAFELEAVDYLTKPVRSERLRAALQRVRQRMSMVARPETAIDGAVLVFSERGRMLRLPMAEVLVLKADQKYVTLRTAERAYLLDETLSELEQRLAELGGDFIRIHRNALVARRAIRALELRGSDEGDGEGWAVRVAPLDEWLAVSRRQVSAVKTAIGLDTRPAPL